MRLAMEQLEREGTVPEAVVRFDVALYRPRRVR
jgi:hypothetical protein